MQRAFSKPPSQNFGSKARAPYIEPLGGNEETVHIYIEYEYINRSRLRFDPQKRWFNTLCAVWVGLDSIQRFLDPALPSQAKEAAAIVAEQQARAP